MVEQAKILKVIGVTKAPTGRGILLTGEIEDRGIVEMLVHRHHFPCGLIQSFLIGETVDVSVETWGEKVVATVLPFENQGLQATGKLLSKLVHTADEMGQSALKKLPVASRARRSMELHTPHPMAAQLERLIKDEPSIEEGDGEEIDY